jgi:hypothetical protein
MDALVLELILIQKVKHMVDQQMKKDMLVDDVN